jgi:hypothetical protein
MATSGSSGMRVPKTALQIPVRRTAGTAETRAGTNLIVRKLFAIVAGACAVSLLFIERLLAGQAKVADAGLVCPAVNLVVERGR